MAPDKSLGFELLQTAKRDLTALKHMLDANAFDDAIFGFHAQQAVEKALKAWLRALGQTHPFTHDLSLLLHQVEESGNDVAPYWALLDLTAYSVRFRYESFPVDAEPLDRERLLVDVSKLIMEVQGVLG